MTKAYFSRREPLYLLREVNDSNGFDAYPVDVDEDVLTTVENIRSVIATMEQVFDTSPAPEEAAQAEADILSELLS